MKIIPAITTKKTFDTVISRQNVEKDRGKMQQRPAILCTNIHRITSLFDQMHALHEEHFSFINN